MREKFSTPNDEDEEIPFSQFGKTESASEVKLTKAEREGSFSGLVVSLLTRP